MNTETESFERGALVWQPSTETIEEISEGTIPFKKGAFVPLHLSGELLDDFENDGTLSFSLQIVSEGILLAMTDTPPLVPLREHVPYYQECFERLASVFDVPIEEYAVQVCEEIGRRRGSERRLSAYKGADILLPDRDLLFNREH